MVFDESVGARKEKALVTIVVPLHAIRRPALVAFDRHDQSRTVTLADMVAANDQPISLCCMHRISYPSLRLSKAASSNSSDRFRVESPELSRVAKGPRALSTGACTRFNDGGFGRLVVEVLEVLHESVEWRCFDRCFDEGRGR